jgi:hypothetical protein
MHHACFACERVELIETIRGLLALQLNLESFPGFDEDAK